MITILPKGYGEKRRNHEAQFKLRINIVTNLNESLVSKLEAEIIYPPPRTAAPTYTRYN